MIKCSTRPLLVNGKRKWENVAQSSLTIKFLVLESVSMSVCVCVCAFECPSRLRDFSFHIDILNGWKYSCMPTLSVVCSRNQKGSWRVRTESRPRLSGDTCPALFICANTSGSCLSFLCASWSTEFRPKIKGSFHPNCTSASLRAVRIAKVVQVLKRVWSRKRFSGTVCSETCF